MMHRPRWGEAAGGVGVRSEAVCTETAPRTLDDGGVDILFTTEACSTWIRREVRDTLIHEVGHLNGEDDDQLRDRGL